jgi:hypothetical protein
MSNLKILIDTTNIRTSNELDRLTSYDPKESLESLIHLFEAFKAGNKAGTATFALDKDPTYSTGIVHIAGEVSVDDVVTVNGVAFTAKASPTTEFLFQADADPAVSGLSLATKFNASTSPKLTSITASNVSGEVTLTVDEPGVIGNSFKLIKTTGANITITDFTGATDGTGVNFTV